MNKNTYDKNLIEINRLAADLQDAWHYAALIAQPADQTQSTFAGSHGYRGLAGMVNAYGDLLRKIVILSYECFPAFTDLELPSHEQIDTVAELKRFATKALRAIELVAKENGIDAHAGEII